MKIQRSSKTTVRLVFWVVALSVSGGATALAQSVPPTPAAADMVVRIMAARRANAALMRQYSWTSRTEVIDQGQVKDLRLDTVNYGPGGQLQRTIMNDQSAPLPMGFLRRRIAEDERTKVEQYLVGLRELLEQYTLPTAGKVQDFMNRATATGPDASGLFQLTGQNVVYPGDTFTLWVNPKARHPQRIQVASTFQGDPISLTATFKTLPTGLNHVAFAEVIVLAKQLSLQVQNFDYNRNN
jgi:hypothetical protein